MALVKLVEIEELSGDPREVAESGFKQYGKVLNTWKAIFNRPTLFGAYLPFLRQVAGPGPLNQNTKDICALYVGLLNHCRYTASHRATSGLNNGLTVEQLQALAKGDWSQFDDATRVALEFTKQLTLNPANVEYSQLPQAVDREVLEQLKSHFDDAEIVDLAMTVSVWNSIARFHRVMDFDLDMPKAPEGVEPK
jgi:alkylhydroperoxidase family enzyme